VAEIHRLDEIGKIILIDLGFAVNYKYLLRSVVMLLGGI
jgi:hypothetical protein